MKVKNIYAYLLVLVLFATSCSKSTESPDLASQVAGVYQINYVLFPELNLEITSQIANNMRASGGIMRITVSKKTNEQASFFIETKFNAKAEYNSQTEIGNLVDAGGGLINVVDPNNKNNVVAKISGGKITGFGIRDAEGVAAILDASK